MPVRQLNLSNNDSRVASTEVGHREKWATSHFFFASDLFANQIFCFSFINKSSVFSRSLKRADVYLCFPAISAKNISFFFFFYCESYRDMQKIFIEFNRVSGLYYSIRPYLQKFKEILSCCRVVFSPRYFASSHVCG